LNKFRGSVKKDAINDVQKVLEQPHIAKALSEDTYAAGYAEAIERFNKILDNFCKDLERFILETQSQLPKTDRLLLGC